MRKIFKSNSPDSFEDWKALSNDDWQPSFTNLQNPEKKVLITSLLDEQGWTCCYCGRRTDEGSCHIEHFRPQESYPHLALEYQNLHASCLRDLDKGAPRHCGHAKKNSFDEDQIIDPKDNECEINFDYSLNGNIEYKNNKAKYMIETLELNTFFLKNRRAQALLGIFDEQIIETITNEELRLIEQQYETRDERNMLEDFSQVIAGYARKLRQQ